MGSHRRAFVKIWQVARVGPGVPLMCLNLADYGWVVFTTGLREKLSFCLLLQDLLQRLVGMDALELWIIFEHLRGNS